MLDLTQVRYSEILTNIGLDYQNEMFVADQIFSIVPVPKDTGFYYTKGREKFLLTQAYRQPGTEANLVTHSYTKTAFATQDYALKEVIPDSVKENSVDPLRPVIDATEFLFEKLRLAKESDALTKISDYTTTFTGFTQQLAAYNATTNPTYVKFDDYINSDPGYVIGLLKSRIALKSGKMPNIIVMNPNVENVIASHPKVKKRFQYVMPLNATNLPDNFLGLKVIRAMAIKDTENEGQIATPTSSYLFPDVIFMGFVTPGAGLWKPCVGYTFERKPLQVREWYDFKLSSTVIEVSWSYLVDVISPRCGMVVYDVIS